MVGIFDKIMGAVKGGLTTTIVPHKADAVIGVDIGSSSIKVVELKKEKGKIVLSTYGSIALGPFQQQSVGYASALDPDIVSNALIEVMKESNIEGRGAVMALQSSASLLFVVELPKNAASALDSVVPNEARKFIPVPIAEVSLNWNVIPDHVEEALGSEMDAQSDKTMEVLVAAIRNDALSAYKNIGGQAGLKVGNYELEVFSAIRSTFHNELSPVVLIDMGASQTRVALVQYGIVMKYHTINRGGMLLTENLERALNISFEKAEELKREVGLTGSKVEVVQTLQTALTSLTTEVKNTILDFEKKYHKAVDKAILVGGGALLPGIQDRMTQELGLPIQMGDPFRKVGNPEFLDAVLSQVGPEFAVSVGAALRVME